MKFPVGFKLIFFGVGLAIGCIFSQFMIKKSTRSRLLHKKYVPPPEGMVFVPAGEFLMGSDHPLAEHDERPRRKEFVRAFYIDQYEVTNRRYKEANPAHSFSPGGDHLPVTKVYREQAKKYCESLGKRLPSGIEWEKAARGTDGRRYPWGDALESGRANFRMAPNDFTSLQAVGSFPEGISPYGCFDMSGNAWEWVGDEYRNSSLFFSESEKVPRAIVRGGAFRYSAFQARTSYQGFEDPKLTCNDIGFRCAKDAEVAK